MKIVSKLLILAATALAMMGCRYLKPLDGPGMERDPETYPADSTQYL